MNFKEVLARLFNPPLKLTEDESRVKEVIEKLLQNPDTKFRISPLTNSVLLKHKETGYYLLIEGNHIKICNHSFTIHSQFRLSFVEMLRKNIDTKIEQDRQEAIAEIFTNQNNVLDEVIKNLTV